MSALLSLCPLGIHSSNSVEVNLQPDQILCTPPAGSIGLSYEAKMLLPDENGKYYFDPDNKAIVNAFQTMGVKSLRIGGNSVDVPRTAIPSPEDIDMLFSFAKEAGIKVIYSFRLRNGDPASAARIAKQIHDKYADLLDYFAIGNEPSYYKDFDNQFFPHWDSIYQAIREVAPDMPFCAPDDNPNPPLYQYVLDHFGGEGGPVKLLTMHNYPGDCAYKNPFNHGAEGLIPVDAAEKRNELLSGEMYKVYQGVYEKVKAAISRGPFKLSECNSVWYGGLLDASDTYTAALWGTDFMYWWASRGCQGFNFHTGDSVGGGSGTVTSRYATFVRAENGLDIRPLAYGLKMFQLGCHGSMIPVSLSDSTQNIAAYACLENQKYVYITLINKNHDVSQASEIRVNLPKGHSFARRCGQIWLKAENGDIATKHDITLGGKSISPEGVWEGEWMKAKAKRKGFKISMEPATEVVIRLKIRS